MTSHVFYFDPLVLPQQNEAILVILSRPLVRLTKDPRMAGNISIPENNDVP